MATTLHPWAVDRPVSSPFAFPEGPLGWLAGQFMLWTYDDREFTQYANVTPGHGHRVLEVGFGAGRLLGRLLDAGAEYVCGVDPSPRMQVDAARRNRRAIAAGQMQLSLGTAERTGQRSAAFDRVVSLHNVALWPDLDAGLNELRRVLEVGGMLVLGWHGGRTDPWTTRNLRLPDEKLETLERALEARFARVERISGTRDDIFRAWA